MISPGAIVRDVHPLLAARAGGDECAVDVEEGFVEEVRRLLLPDLEPGLIEDILEGLDVVSSEAAAEVARGGGVGDAVGAQGVQEDDVVAPQFDIVEAGPVAQRVVGEVQDMVGLMVGEVELEQMESLIDGRIEAELADQELNGADAAAGDGSNFNRGFVLDVAGGDDRLERGGGDRTIEPASDFALARGVVAVWNRFHSKSPSGIWHETWAGQSNVP